MTDLYEIPDFLRRTDFHKPRKLTTWRERMPVMPDKHKPKRWLPTHMDDVSRKLLREIEAEKARKRVEKFKMLRERHGTSRT